MDEINPHAAAHVAVIFTQNAGKNKQHKCLLYAPSLLTQSGLCFVHCQDIVYSHPTACVAPYYYIF